MTKHEEALFKDGYTDGFKDGKNYMADKIESATLDTRDKIAMAALQGMMAGNWGPTDNNIDIADIDQPVAFAASAYTFADAMLKQRAVS